ncbi:class I SAM-dependent methyltransferase [Allorhodopirellula solitaria]|nr:class I SAM-dependent methyltransferase [Allorhodopirellula solitaria]
MSPLALEDIVCIRTFDTSEIVRRWKENYEIDISSELIAKKSQISLMQGEHSTIRFFTPLNIAGSDQFYSEFHTHKLEHWGDEYYRKPRWEHREVLAGLSGDLRVLEVGCGSGAFLDACKARKVEAVGVELNGASVAFTRRRGLDVFHGGISEFVASDPAAFDVVCAFQVLEHVSDPLGFVNDALRTLKTGGRLVIAVPNNDSFLGSQDNLLDIPPHHMLQWSETSLRFLSEVLPVRVLRVRREPLSCVHRPGFESVQNHRIDVAFSHLPRKLRSLGKRTVQAVTRSPLRRLLTGQSIYIEFRKTNESTSS